MRRWVMRIEWDAPDESSARACAEEVARLAAVPADRWDLYEKHSQEPAGELL